MLHCVTKTIGDDGQVFGEYAVKTGQNGVFTKPVVYAAFGINIANNNKQRNDEYVKVLNE